MNEIAERAVGEIRAKRDLVIRSVVSDINRHLELAVREIDKSAADAIREIRLVARKQLDIDKACDVIFMSLEEVAALNAVEECWRNKQ